ncbi:MAG: M50 family metallopeptidase [Candidatus Dormibacteria bacterium]
MSGLIDLLVGLASFIALILIIVGIHEGGHYSAAKLVGVRVLEFNIGFGRKLLYRTVGDTMYALRAIPLGGYVLLHGMARPAKVPWLSDQANQEMMRRTGSIRELLDENEGGAGAFLNKAVWKRMIVILAGPLANFVLAFAIISVDLATGDAGTIAQVSPNSPAALAGIHSGDRIVSIDGSNITYTRDIFNAVGARHGDPVEVAVMRSGQRLVFTLAPHYDSQLGRYLMGVQPGHVRLAPLEALAAGKDDTVRLTTGTISGIADLLGNRVQGGALGPQGVTGVVGIAQATAQQAQAGPDAFVSWMAFISVQLGILNLLPLPVLDGGRLVLLALEAVRRRPLDAGHELVVNYVGLALIIAVAVVVNLNSLRLMVLPH